MKKSTYSLIGVLLLGVAAGVVAGAICKTRKQKLQQQLSDVAEEGYETARDIMHPGSSKSLKGKKLRYGPVF